MTVGALVRAAAARLVGAGVSADEARLDAELLARHLLGIDRAAFIVREIEPADGAFEQGFGALVARRAARVPIAYILGHAEFWGLDFEVTPDVLVPRPETELIVETVLDLFRGGPGPSRLVDAGTGSGCIAVALAREYPASRLTATDISARAIEVARRNARRHGVADRIVFLVCALTGQARDCDLVVSNPPYVPAGDRDGLQPEVRDHEPATALLAGADGLDVIRELTADAWNALRSGGWLVFEFGFGQQDAVLALIGDPRPATPVAAGGPHPVVGDGAPRWADVSIRRDLQGIPRVAAARRPRLA